MVEVRGVTRVWADWLVYGVRYGSSRGHIESVFAFADAGDAVGRKHIFSRQEVVESLLRGTTFCTVYATGLIEWKRGAAVSAIELDGTKYLTTTANQRREDNLGELPEM